MGINCFYLAVERDGTHGLKESFFFNSSLFGKVKILFSAAFALINIASFVSKLEHVLLCLLLCV